MRKLTACERYKVTCANAKSSVNITASAVISCQDIAAKMAVAAEGMLFEWIVGEQ